MNIGYACICLNTYNTHLRTVNLKSATNENLYNIIQSNLNALDEIINYNIENKIKLYRISSDLIPFGLSNVNQLPWYDMFKDKFASIGKKITENGIRVSLHPGQYTIINSIHEDVVNRSYLDLDYHSLILDLLGVDSTNKIILHIGGVYDNKDEAIQRFITNYNRIDSKIKTRLVIENDDKSYNIFDVLQISKSCNIPVVFDNLHNSINCYDNTKDDKYWIELCAQTWKQKDGRQKIHYSQQDKEKIIGSHSNTINIEEFSQFVKQLDRDNIDIMLEVKDKNLSTIKCQNCLINKDITYLKKEWTKYKYLVWSKSKSDYEKLEELVASNEYQPFEFYKIIKENEKKQEDVFSVIEVIKQINCLIKDETTNEEQEKLAACLKKYVNDEMSVTAIKKYLLKLLNQYHRYDLTESYFFFA